MKLQDLETGMLVEIRNGILYKIVLDYETQEGTGALFRKSGFVALTSYNKNLKHKEKSDFDIMKIYIPKCDIYVLSFDVNEHLLLWQRKEVKELTMGQLNDLLNELGYDKEVKIVE